MGMQFQDDDLWEKMSVDLKLQTQQIKWVFNEIKIEQVLQWIQEIDNDLYNVIIDAPTIQGQPIGPLWIYEQINNINNNNYLLLFLHTD